MSRESDELQGRNPQTVYLVFGQNYESVDIGDAFTTREAAEEAIEQSITEDHEKSMYRDNYRVVEVDLHDSPKEFKPYL